MKNLKLTGYIKGNSITYAEGNWNEQFAQFKKDNEGKFIEVQFTRIDPVQHRQYRYLWGYVYPAIAHGMGEKDLKVVHLTLKQQFLQYKVKGVEEIEYKKNAIILMDGPDVVGYIRSLTTLDVDEMKQYILACEGIRDGLIDWTLPAEALKLRKEII